MSLNRLPLLQHGFFIPKSLSPYASIANHERLTTMALQTEKLSDDIRIAAGLRTQHDVEQHRYSVMQAFKNELSELSQDDLVLVLSNEHCQSRLVCDEEVRRLQELLDPFCESVNVIVYLRPQHELATSLYNQALKAGHSDISILPDFQSPGGRWVERRYFDYHDLTCRWTKVFGDCGLTPRIFDRRHLLNNSIIQDFHELIGCGISDLEMPQDVNKNMSADLQSVLNLINVFCKKFPSELDPSLRAKVIATFEKLSTGAEQRPSRSDAQAFFAKFAGSNCLVKDRYFPDRSTLFETDFDNYPRHQQSSPDQADDAVRLILRLISRKDE